MTAFGPQFVLIARIQRIQTYESLHRMEPVRMGWRFLLRASDGSCDLDVSDEEPDVFGERLELLSAIRGLEALEQPSRVQLLTDSRYVIRGLRFGIPQWKAADWCWELHGQMVGIRDKDLWQRIDRALEIHEVTYRWLRLDSIVSGRLAPPITRPPRGSGVVPAPHWLRRRDVPTSIRADGNTVRHVHDVSAHSRAEEGIRLRICSPDDDQ